MKLLKKLKAWCKIVIARSVATKQSHMRLLRPFVARPKGLALSVARNDVTLGSNVKKICLLAFLILLSNGLSFAADNNAISHPQNLESFSRIAILHEGRLKPLDTYARSVLLQFSGKRTFDKKPAIDWLAKLLFVPWQTADDKVFLINSPEIPMALGFKPDTHRRYSFSQLEPNLNKFRQLAIAADAIDEKQRSLVETEILRVYNNVSLYLKIRSAFSLAMPHADFALSDQSAKTLLDFPSSKNNFSFLDIALKADVINNETKDLGSKKSEQWSSEEKDFMRLLRNLYQWSQNATEESLAIFPSVNPQSETWHSAWEMAKHDFSDPQTQKELGLLLEMHNAYTSGHQLEFHLAAKAFNLEISKRINGIQKRAYNKIPIEIFYNHTSLFLFAWIFYLLAFFAFLFSLVWPRPLLHTVGFLLLGLGFLPHLIALVLRMIIMSRPPVTNLYETFVFVGVVTVLLSLLTEVFNKKWLGIVVGSICGFIFLAIADKFSAEGDTLKMLVAVLDSNFWLTTHVLSITIGYAGCCVAGIMGHVYILQALFKPKNKELLNSTYRYILGILGFGLTMAFLGTMLGGIWADQSWGRFWGWDPKENGALLIVLWTSIIFHAKVGRMINPLGVAVGAAMGFIVVMWAWFGVNLLSIGLHSYGFTSGIAANLAIYVALEVAFLGASVIILGKKGMPV